MQSGWQVRNISVAIVIAVLIVVPITAAAWQFRSEVRPRSFTLPDSGSIDVPLPNYDIREDRGTALVDYLASARRNAGWTAADIADLRDQRVRGETDLRARMPKVKIEYNRELGSPEVISPDVLSPTVELLSLPSVGPRTEILRRFVVENNDLFGISDREARALIVSADYANPDGGLSFAHLEQRLGGIPVFRGEIKAGFTSDGRIVRVINNLAARLGRGSLSIDFGDPIAAVKAASDQLNFRLLPADLSRNDRSSSKNKAVFGGGDWPTTAEKMYFPTEPGVAVPAWRVLIWRNAEAYYVIVDAKRGTMLWRKNISEDQSAPATYNVYGNLTSPTMTADSPTPFTPGCSDPNNCLQPPIVAGISFTLIGNEAPLTFNNLGWIPDTGLPVRVPADPNITDGNNGEAGIDRDGTQGVDPQGHAFGNPNRVFNYAYNPAPGNPPPGDNPTPPNPQTYPPTPFQQGVATHGFYLLNRWHDEMYKLGFTEPAGNFQHFNFGRGGGEGDRISFEVQDSSGTNGANFATPADGGRGRMQNFFWTGSTPSRDGTLDSTIVVHELTHGLTNRLHGNTTGLNSNMSRGIGEGWSDFYALALLSEPTDNPCGTHPIGGYIAYEIFPGYPNHYYGIRRFPVAKIGCLGPNGLPHDPLTFGNLNAGNCSTFASAYPRGPFGSGTCDQDHNAGEIWASALWEMRGRLIHNSGPSEGNRKSLQYITDGMKLSPLNPTFLQARDAIIAAASVGSLPDVAAVREGFRRRGMGYSASIQVQSPAAVTEAFDYAPGQLRSPFDFDGDGKTDPSVYRPSMGDWYLLNTTTGFRALHFGLPSDIMVPADYTGDGKTDMAVWRPSDSIWYILRSEDNTFYGAGFGANGDIPAPGDYDGDGRADLVVIRPGASQSFWYLQQSTAGFAVVPFGLEGDVPTLGDYDGDGKNDVAVYRPSAGAWFRFNSSNGSFLGVGFGQNGDKVVPADYTGDGKTDLAVFRPSTNIWYILRSEDNSLTGGAFGSSGDLPSPGDYDGDGRADLAVYRLGATPAAQSVFYVLQTTAGFNTIPWGLGEDRPVPGAYVY